MTKNNLTFLLILFLSLNSLFGQPISNQADFPSYIQEMKASGIVSYEHFVSDGHIQYFGANDFTISAEAKWPPIEVAEIGEAEKLKRSLAIHQHGQTDYPIFCKQSAEAGVEK